MKFDSTEQFNGHSQVSRRLGAEGISMDCQMARLWKVYSINRSVLQQLSVVQVTGARYRVQAAWLDKYCGFTRTYLVPRLYPVMISLLTRGQPCPNPLYNLRLVFSDNRPIMEPSDKSSFTSGMQMVEIKLSLECLYLDKKRCPGFYPCLGGRDAPK